MSSIGEDGIRKWGTSVRRFAKAAALVGMAGTAFGIAGAGRPVHANETLVPRPSRVRPRDTNGATIKVDPPIAVMPGPVGVATVTVGSDGKREIRCFAGPRGQVREQVSAFLGVREEQP